MASRGLYPSPASLEAWTTCAAAMQWAGVSTEVWKAFATELGDAGLDNLALLAAIPPAMARQALGRLRGPEGAPFSALASAKVSLLYNAARLKYSFDVEDLLQDPAVVVPAAPVANTAAVTAAGVAVVTPPWRKVSLALVLDQGCQMEASMLPEAQLAQMRARYVTVMGDPPPEGEEVTDGQLTALHAKDAAGAGIYADFGVWGKHGDRLARRLVFNAQFWDGAGSWKMKELPGPDSLETWVACWRVFRTAAVMLSLAHPATLLANVSKPVLRWLCSPRCHKLPKSTKCPQSCACVPQIICYNHGMFLTS